MDTHPVTPQQFLNKHLGELALEIDAIEEVNSLTLGDIVTLESKLARMKADVKSEESRKRQLESLFHVAQATLEKVNRGLF